MTLKQTAQSTQTYLIQNVIMHGGVERENDN